MSERLNTGAIAYGTIAAANAARGHMQAATRADRSRRRLLAVRAEVEAAKDRLRAELARRR